MAFGDRVNRQVTAIDPLIVEVAMSGSMRAL
jgi:hypothetical protein